MERALPTRNHPRTALNATILLLVVLITIYWGTYSQHDLVAIGCDNFGYARQAELFRDHGLAKGLDTSIHEPQADLLVALAQSTFGSSSAWYEAVAPHCHHYNSRHGGVILQYPPGSGLLLSLFPEAVAMPCLLIAGSFFAAGLLLWLATARQLSPLAIIVASGATITFFWTISQGDTLASASVPITLILLPAAAVLAAALPGKSPITAGIFGLLCGLLLTIRIPNGLLVIGLIVHCTIANKLWRISNLITLWRPITVSLITFLIGATPLLLANKINAGGWFHTTYSSIDASRPIIHWEQIRDGFIYYFSNPLGGPLLLIATGALFISLLTWANHPKPYVPAASIGALALLLLSLAFFVTHSVRIPYYIVPSCVLTVIMVTVEIINNERKIKRSWKLLFILPLIVLAISRLHAIKPSQVTVKVPEEIMTPSAVVWSDITGGTLYYYKERYTSKLNFTDQETQDKLVAEVRAAGHTQYLVVDSEQMQQACDRQAARYGVAYVGSAEVFGTRKIWRIDPKETGLLKSCNLPQ